MATRNGRVALGGAAAAVAFTVLLIPFSLYAIVGGIVGISQGMVGSGYQAYNPASSPAASQGITSADLANLDLYEGAEADTGTPWQALAAVTYYETGPGAGYATVPGTCPPSTPPPGQQTQPTLAPIYCAAVPPTTAAGAAAVFSSPAPAAQLDAFRTAGPATTTPPAMPTTTTDPYIGPMQIDRSALSPSDWANATGLAWSANWVGQRLHSSLTAMPSWDSQALSTGEIYSSDGQPSIDDTTQGAATVRSDWVKALNELPVADAQDPVFDQNVFTIAVDWSIGAVPPSGGQGGAPIVCTITTGSTGTSGSTTTTAPAASSTTTTTVPAAKTVTIVDNSGSTLALTAEQVSNAEQIVAEDKALNQSAQNTVVSLMVALTESVLVNYSNVNVPGSQNPPPPAEPSQKVGSDGTSLGLFQQQNNWGSIVERMDPAQSTADFLGYGTYSLGLKQIEASNPSLVGASDALSDGILSQLVQESAFPARYQAWFQGATELAAELGGASCTTGAVATGSLTAAQAAAVVALAHQQIGLPYVFGGGGTSGPSGQAVAPPGQVGQPGFDCSGLVQYVYAKAAGIVLPRTSFSQWAAVQKAGHFIASINQEGTLNPGDLVFFNGSDPPSPGHVGIYIGNDQMIDAPSTGHDVRIESVSSFGGFVGGGAL